MKKLFVLVLVLAMTQMSWAGLATLAVNSADVNPLGYVAGDIITIELTTAFEGGTDTTGSISMDAITATAGQIMSTSINAGFNDLFNPGAIQVGGLSATGIAGTTSTTAPDIGSGAVLWSMEFKVLGTADITISTTNFFAAPSDFSDTAGATNDLTLHVTPEPMTLGLLALGGLFIRRK